MKSLDAASESEGRGFHGHVALAADRSVAWSRGTARQLIVVPSRRELVTDSEVVAFVGTVSGCSCRE
jgi:hypothetical protein